MDLDTDKRMILALALSFGVLILWRVFLVKEPPPPPPKPATPTQAAAPSASQPPPAAAAKLPRPVALPVQQGTSAQDITVEGDVYRVTFSTQGAVVKSWVLPKYKDEKGNLLDVVDPAACEKLGFPMSLRVADKAQSDKLNTVLYVANPSGATVKAPATVEFTFSDGKMRARKQFTFANGYEIRAEVSVFDGQRYLPVEVSWPGGFGDHSLTQAQKQAGAKFVYTTGTELKFARDGKVKEDHLVSGPFRLAGLEDRYFADLFLPLDSNQPFGEAYQARAGRQEWSPPDWKEKEKPKPLVISLGIIEPKPLPFRLLVAPKDLDVLRGVKPGLGGLVDFGWFSFVAKPLFLGLRYIYEHWTHNYGWAIVILTVFINLAMFPLKMKQLRSAQEMQRIAPLVKSIQEKYKQYKFNDPRKQRMNQEMMKLYQEHHINPLGGCLPMLPQIPFLYAFYNVLTNAIELRHAPWIWWIKDLSAPDPLYILPTVMIVTMFIMQKMTPMTTADPAQQRMMMIMPLVFGIMFYSFASGLVLFWLTGNVVAIAQQVFINKAMPPPEPLPFPRKSAPGKDKER
jgi:YidC/Oxa1 family membrane protein insertase